GGHSHHRAPTALRTNLSQLADRIVVRPKVSRCRLAYNSNRLCVVAILIGKRPAANNLNSHALEVIRAHYQVVRCGISRGGRSSSLDIQAASAAARNHWKPRDYRR